MSQRQAVWVAFRLFLGCLTVAAIALQPFPNSVAKNLTPKEAMRFAADMAERGNWREAGYRWEKLLSQGVADAKIYNNLAVAAEAAGEMDVAADYYGKALGLAGRDPDIVDNYHRYNRLQEQLTQHETEADRESADQSPSLEPVIGGDKAKGKTSRVTVSVPIPPRINVEGLDTLLVASFLTEQTLLLDVRREMSRFLRGEFRKRTRLEVLDVVPPPEIPEQRLEDLIRNAEFWKHLGREYEADLIVSGVVTYGRQEVSGFEEVDVVSPTTGQKVRETRFVEQEEFSYVLDLLFIDGATGTLLFRDRLHRAVRFRGLMNDPIHAFYELSEMLSNDIVSVVATRMQVETRMIFKR